MKRIEEVSWEDISGRVEEICPEFAKIVNTISPPNSQKLIKVKYPFGAEIVSRGQTFFPSEKGSMLPIDDPSLPKFVKKNLNYNSVPVGLVIKNSVEVYKELDDRVFSIAFWGKGLQLGIWEYFDWATPYSVTAGARSLYMVPRITLSAAHKRLKREFNVTLPPQKKASGHWRLFVQIANSNNFTEEWDCEVLYLPKAWIEKFHLSGPWHQLYNHLLCQGWLHSEYARKKSIFDVLWQVFANSLEAKGLKPNSYVMDTLKHLAFIGTGVLPASQPALGSNGAGPIEGIQKAYLDVYGLKDYVPTIMQPQYLHLDRKTPVYYSLQSPTLLESVPKSRTLTSIVDNVRELMELGNHFLSEAFDEHLKIANVSICEIVSQLKFDFFHEDAYAYGESIRPSSEMPLKDAALTAMPNSYKNRKFADTAAYWHGCVRIGVK